MKRKPIFKAKKNLTWQTQEEKKGLIVDAASGPFAVLIQFLWITKGEVVMGGGLRKD